MDVVFADDRIEFTDYRFPGASVHPAGMITARQIRDVDWKTPPPELRTRDGETLFITAEQRTELRGFCHRNHVAHRRRYDVWGDLLEPYLDTWFDPPHEAATRARLIDAGFPDMEVAAIRAKVGPAMRSYNSLVWDWCHLGLCDLLDAATGGLVKPRIQASLGDPVALYHWAKTIAQRQPRMALPPGGAS